MEKIGEDVEDVEVGEGEEEEDIKQEEEAGSGTNREEDKAENTQSIQPASNITNPDPTTTLPTLHHYILHTHLTIL